jgi:hypothetical protein
MTWHPESTSRKTSRPQQQNYYMIHLPEYLENFSRTKIFQLIRKFSWKIFRTHARAATNTNGSSHQTEHVHPQGPLHVIPRLLTTDTVKSPHQPPYTAPYEVVKRPSDFLFVIRVGGKGITISTESLKLAYIVKEDSYEQHSSEPLRTYPGKEKSISFNNDHHDRSWQCQWGGRGWGRSDRTSCAGRRTAHAHRSHDRMAMSVGVTARPPKATTGNCGSRESSAARQQL